MRRLLGSLVLPVVLAVFLAGCSNSGLGVALSGDTNQANASAVSCEPGYNSVTVSGSFTAAPGSFGSGRGPPMTLPDGSRIKPSLVVSIGPSATIFDGSDHQIGAFDGPDVTLRPNRATPFRFVVPVEAGSPASCSLSWSSGPAPVIGE